MFKGGGGGVRVRLESASGWRYRASDFQSVKVLGLCFTLIGWLFSPQMLKILELLVMGLACECRQRDGSTHFSDFFAKVRFHPCFCPCGSLIPKWGYREAPRPSVAFLLERSVQCMK